VFEARVQPTTIYQKVRRKKQGDTFVPPKSKPVINKDVTPKLVESGGKRKGAGRKPKTARKIGVGLDIIPKGGWAFDPRYPSRSIYINDVSLCSYLLFHHECTQYTPID